MNRAYKIILSLVIISCSVLCMPFSYSKKINAAPSVSGANPIIGVNVRVIDYERTKIMSYYSKELDLKDGQTYFRCTSASQNPCTQWTNGATNGTLLLEWDIDYGVYSFDTNKYIYEYEFIFDNNYVGYITFDTFYVADDQLDDPWAEEKTYYVNGSSLVISGTYPRDNWVVTNYELNLNYQETWYYPIESFTTNYNAINNGFEIVGLNNSFNYMFPIYRINSVTNKNLYSFNINPNKIRHVIMWVNIGTIDKNNFTGIFKIANGVVVDNIRVIRSDQNNRIIDVAFKNTNNYQQQLNMQAQTSNPDHKVALIYSYNDGDYGSINTDFALSFGLSNSMLDNINLIAQGNQQSQQSSSTAQTTNQNAQSTFEQEEQLINNQEQAMQQNLDNLDIQNKNNNLFGNSKFIASAQWVKQQFDWFTNNNAFGYLITFSLVIGLALVIVGKLRG